MLFRARKETFLPDYSVHGVLQARKPEWVAITNSFWQLVGQLENF